MGGQQLDFDDFGAFEQPHPDDRDTVSRTIVFQIPTLTAKKAGLLNRAMKDYRKARAIACEHLQDVDPVEFTLGDQNNLASQIGGYKEITLPAREIAYAVRTVLQNYKEYARSKDASPPEATRADTLSITRRSTRIFHNDERYYLNVRTGIGNVNLPLQTSDESHHMDVLPDPTIVPARSSEYQQRDGVKWEELASDDFPHRTQKLSSSTLQKKGPRQFTANLTFQIAKRRERTYSPDDAQYAVGVDRGRNQLAYAALYDRDDDHVINWCNRSGDEVEHYMTEFSERIQKFQSNGVWDEMDEARQRRFRYKKQVDYEIANNVVDMARDANGSVVIVLEDLQGMSKLGNYAVENRRFNEWSYYRLGQFIEQKAAPHDIPVERVDPRNTSQDCSRCGEDEAAERQSVFFKCRNCGYQQHADANAAVNTAKRFCQ